MFTMVASRTTISWAMPMKASAFQRCGSGAGGAVESASGTEELRYEDQAARGGAAAGAATPASLGTTETTPVPRRVAEPAVPCTGRAPHAARGRPTVGSVDADQLRAEVGDFLITRR